jgi:type II secretory pathway pseudopilin PulG
MRARLRIQDESGSLLIDLLVAMTIMVIAVGAILSAYAAGYISLRDASTQGNALTLADKQIELYNTLPNALVKLDASTIPTGSDPYVTAHSSDSTIPSSSGQVTGATATAGSCTAPTTPQSACAVQTVTGPDGRPYRVDTYIVSVTPNASYPSRTDQSVTVVVRTNDGGTPGSIAARTSSVYDSCNPPPPTSTTTSC